MSTKQPRLKALDVETTQGRAGTLVRESQFVFRYADEALPEPARAISLTMPVSPAGYAGNRIPPVLAMQLPEGFLLNYLHEHFGKSVDLRDEMNLLGLVSTPSAGRLHAHLPQAAAREMGPPIPIGDLISARGTEKLFAELLEKYSLAISGVMPKVVVPSAEGSVGEKSHLHTPDLIVKTDGGEYPGLAENEFHCMSIVARAGLSPPPYWLSDDRKLFMIRRFDIAQDASYLGFEDAATLMGRHADDKYKGSFSQVAKVIEINSAPARRKDSLERFYRQLVLCCLLRNGDAHLKNWGVLYSNPARADEDATLSPPFDMVCTRAFLREDAMALSIGGTRDWPDRETLERFGRDACSVSDPGEVIDELREAAASYTPADPGPAWEPISVHIEEAVASLAPGQSRRLRR